MTILTLEIEPLATKVQVTEDRLIVELADGRSITVPISWYPRLMNGTVQERQHCQLLGEGYAIEWPDLDEHIGIEGLLAGRRSSESKKSISQWMEERKKRL